ncbi:Ig-like domain-containing protein [Lewinella sp. JB7]|uniref:Ig-like domain-containing protein n=1 Tax=Lewinella sp. JB7 TaxID=2962887 RepID=UPI0020C9E8CE|nr:carboxypeptidase regulatory-like domain-containing protein [Lewinella sp. JB7]MCP9235662.1 carboxypeptidase regulatory-like domain-containing protein [Lewinella sp. JB7]
MRKLLAALFFLLALVAQSVSLQHCATPTPPRGGDVDSIGPRLILEKSTPNFQTNFRPERIVLTFDEWVQLDPQQQIIISPPLDLRGDNRPVLQRRSLIIPLEGLTLLDNVTYVVNIGAAIKDLNEGNPTKNLRFVFATGPVLDTASVSGTVVDAFSGEPVDGATFTLYGNLADTAVYTENPTYFAITDKQGAFTVSNVKPGRYRAVALLRSTGATTYFADYAGVFPPTAVGYLDSTVTVVDDDNPIGTLRISAVPVTPRITEAETDRFGIVKIGVNQPARNVDLRSRRSYLRSDVGDTIRLFYREPAADTILLGRDSAYTDTLVVSGTGVGAEELPPLTTVGRSSSRVNPGEGITLVFNRPLESLDTSRMNLFRDTLPQRLSPRYEIDTLDPTRLLLFAGGDGAAPFRLELLPGAVTDWYARTNADSIVRTLNIDSRESYGDLTINLVNLNGAVSYILRLIDDSGNVIVGSRRYVDRRFTYTAVYRSLKPGTYRMELVYDSNNNGRYDAGDLRFGLQPEVVQRFEIEPLRANWEVEKTVDLENN